MKADKELKFIAVLSVILLMLVWATNALSL